jgi:hypothetical protein
VWAVISFTFDWRGGGNTPEGVVGISEATDIEALLWGARGICSSGKVWGVPMSDPYGLCPRLSERRA